LLLFAAVSVVIAGGSGSPAYRTGGGSGITSGNGGCCFGYPDLSRYGSGMSPFYGGNDAFNFAGLLFGNNGASGNKNSGYGSGSNQNGGLSWYSNLNNLISQANAANNGGSNPYGSNKGSINPVSKK
jgi:hypothetical protein